MGWKSGNTVEKVNKMYVNEKKGDRNRMFKYYTLGSDAYHWLTTANSSHA